ncbi:alpha/beta hydrolase [Candidatus Uhrbacteria bacterium]|nr:alpha/beta hydrolase [Candidatus Uhrbacteria bacterium]
MLKGKIISIAVVTLITFFGFLFFFFQRNTTDKTELPSASGNVHAPESTPGDDVEVERDMMTSDNVRLHYWFYNRGTATVTIFLHGGPGRETYDFRDTYMPDNYADRFGSLLLFDQRGGGRSDTLQTNPHLQKSSMTFARFIQDINELRDYVIPGHHAIIWGRSFGGLLAAAYAASNPVGVEAYVLFSPGYFDKSISDKGNEQINALNNGIQLIDDFVTVKALKKEQALIAEEYKHRPKHDPGSAQRSTTDVGDAMNENEQLLTKNNFPLLTAMADAPVFVQYGGYDGIIPPLAIEAMKPYLHGATYFEIPEEDHFAAYAHPDEVYDALKAFYTAHHVEGLRY